jgi:hypothetical protein
LYEEKEVKNPFKKSIIDESIRVRDSKIQGQPRFSSGSEDNMDAIAGNAATI